MVRAAHAVRIALVAQLGCGRVGFASLDGDAGAGGDAAPLAGCVREVATGSDHTCAVRLDGELLCWGANSNGQLGTGAQASSLTPVEVIAAGAQRVFVGPHHGCAVTGAGLACWGRNVDGELGDGTNVERTTPTPIVGPAAGQPASAGGFGEDFACALFAGAAWCWGDNTSGQLGDGTTTAHAIAAPVASAGQPAFTAIALGTAHACALGSDGSVWCWGAGGDGALGGGTLSNRSVPGQIAGLTATAVTAAGNNTCAIASDGSAYCWGADVNGELGNDLPLSSSAVPVPVTGLGPTPAVTSLSCGGVHCCAVLADATARCWGRHNGRLGDGDPVPSTDVNPVPVVVSNLTDAVQIAAGLDSTCARRISGAVDCWGQNDDGELGRGVIASSNVPVTSSATGSQQLAMSGYHACSIDAAGRLTCWGSNADGELGAGGATDAEAPERVASGVRSVAAGTKFTCAAFDDGQVRCWGRPSSGRLGTGAFGQLPRPNPVAVQATPGLDDAVSVTAGLGAACAATSAGAAFCWGANSSGELGDGTTSSRNAPTPPLLPAGTTVAEIHVGDAHACARTTAGAIWCWGSGGGGRLGNGSTTASTVPLQTLAPAGGAWTTDALRVGSDAACARDTAGALYCWGANGDGDLGDGTTTNRTAPTLTAAGSPVEAFAAGHQLGCAVVAGVAACWGEPDAGKLGDGTLVNRPTPGPVTGLPPVIAIETGDGDHVCAIDESRRVWCWGAGMHGQLGVDRKDSAAPRPVAVPCP